MRGLQISHRQGTSKDSKFYLLAGSCPLRSDSVAGEERQGAMKFLSAAYVLYVSEVG